MPRNNDGSRSTNDDEEEEPHGKSEFISTLDIGIDNANEKTPSNEKLADFFHTTEIYDAAVSSSSSSSEEFESDYDSDYDDAMPLLISTDRRGKDPKGPIISERGEKIPDADRVKTYSSLFDISYLKESQLRAILLSMSLCFTLLAFWLLDSLKDSVFALFVGGDLERHQPVAKMLSVLSTLVLVCLIELASHEKNKQKRQEKQKRSNENRWASSWDRQQGTSVLHGVELQPSIPANIFWYVGIPYVIIFLLIALCLRKHPEIQNRENNLGVGEDPMWRVLGYFVYLAIESFGSISVAAFWAFTNASLDLESAKRHYGFIIAVAQIGAILGSTIATSAGTVSGGMPSLFVFAVLAIVVNMIIMKVYEGLYPQPLRTDNALYNSRMGPIATQTPASMSRTTGSRAGSSFLSGVYLILRYNYLLLILGVSCLYEVALTCMDYELKMVGLAKFTLEAQMTEASSVYSNVTNMESIGEGFTVFMGRYGQLTNVLSLLVSFFGFPVMMRRLGLRLTLRVFPTLLLFITILVFTVPNLWVMFTCMALLKSVVYSINEPAKEVLYMPTSTVVKFKAKFWIDIVGARFAKAIGSSITNHAGSAKRLLQIGSLPSILCSMMLLLVCIWAGDGFDQLIESGEIVGLEDEFDDNTECIQYERVQLREDSDDDSSGGFRDNSVLGRLWGNNNSRDRNQSEDCISFEEPNAPIELINLK